MNGKASHHIWRERPLEALRGNITRRYVTSDRMMLGEVTFEKGDSVPPHRHENEQFTHVLRGCLKFTLGDKGEDTVVVAAGEVIVIPSDLLHAVEALEDTLEYDMFTPPRQDWIDSESAFLRG
ncbi:MAG: cupin domain-containing protein [Amaricoccus sp.]|uniref:cupin domain-containing protein n=1 Tax=Amaricoccus sp. TaxID=1872485 RepID=UPI0039E44429